MHVGQAKIVKIKFAYAYGGYNAKAIVSIDKDQIHPDTKVGSIFYDKRRATLTYFGTK